MARKLIKATFLHINTLEPVCSKHILHFSSYTVLSLIHLPYLIIYSVKSTFVCLNPIHPSRILICHPDMTLSLIPPAHHQVALHLSSLCLTAVLPSLLGQLLSFSCFSIPVLPLIRVQLLNDRAAASFIFIFTDKDVMNNHSH